MKVDRLYSELSTSLDEKGTVFIIYQYYADVSITRYLNDIPIPA